MISKRNVIKLITVLLGVLVLLLLNHYQKVKIRTGTVETVVEIGEKVVHIDGEVNQPGVYTLKSDERLNTLIEMAGGLTNDADTNRINLARKIEDGEKITIYPFAEEPITYYGLDIINYGDKETLEGVNGIGEVIAERIILYRESEGAFTDINQLLSIEGIGEQKLKLIKSSIGD